MNVEVIETSPLEREVQVAVDSDRVDSECTKALNELKGRVRVKGFRPGKVPRRELERRYGRSVRRDVVKTLIQQTLSETLQGEDLKAVLHVSPPEVLDDSGSGGFSYRFRAELKPEVTPTGYLGLSLAVEEPEVADEDVAEALEQLRVQHAILMPVEDRDVVEAGDWVMLQVVRPTAEGEPQSQDTSLDLGDDSLPEPLRDGIVGMKVGEAKDIDMTPPEAEAEADDAAENKLNVTVQGIKRRELPELDDELAELAGDVDTLDELRAKVRDDLEARAKRELAGKRRKALEGRLLETAEFELPAGYLASRVGEATQQRLRMMGADPDQVDPSFAEDLRTHLQGEVEQRVRLEFVLAAIAEREGVKVSEADFKRAIDEVTRGAGAHADLLRQLYTKPAHRAALEDRVRLDKTLDFLLSKATISQQAPAEEAATEATDSPSGLDTTDEAAPSTPPDEASSE